MRRLIFAIICLVAAFTASTAMAAVLPQEQAIVDQINTQLPMDMGDGIYWTEFDIADNGDFVMTFKAAMLPAASEITPEEKASFAEAMKSSLVEDNKIAEICKALNRGMLIKVSNDAGEPCLEQHFAVEEL